MQARMLMQGREQEQKMVFYAVSLSVILHIVLFALFVILPEISGKSQPVLEPIHVKIVGGGGAPGPMPTTQERAPVATGTSDKAPTTTAKPDTSVEPVYIPPPVETPIAPSVYSTPKPEEQQKPVEPTDDAANVKTFTSQTQKPTNATQKVEQIQRSLQQQQQQTQTAAQRSETAVQESETGTESVASAIQQLRDKQAAEQAGAASGGGGTGTAGIGTGSGSGSGSGGQGFGGVGGPLDIYLGIIIPIIEKNWSFSPSMFNGTPRMEVVLSVRIMPDGEIKDISFAKKSGNAYLDESAFKALAKSSPLPAFGSSGIKKSNIEIQFRFTPKGLQY